MHWINANFMLQDCLQKFDCIHLAYLILEEIIHHQNQLLFVIFLNLYMALGTFWFTKISLLF